MLEEVRDSTAAPQCLINQDMERFSSLIPLVGNAKNQLALTRSLTRFLIVMELSKNYWTGLLPLKEISGFGYP
jgi:hypothetical protein